jgi:GNAT superfamily N-acetyltransferase
MLHWKSPIKDIPSVPSIALPHRPDSARLRDGRPIRFGPITPAARPLIERAIARLSPESSRRRFFTPRFRLSDRELDALTRLDGNDRFALGAVVEGADGVPEGIGVARFVRDADHRDSAEVAILVVDAFQGQGVGRSLLARLALDAIARGIARFRGMVMTDNDPMLQFLQRYAPGRTMARVDGHLTFEVPLTAREAAAAV